MSSLQDLSIVRGTLQSLSQIMIATRRILADMIKADEAQRKREQQIGTFGWQSQAEPSPSAPLSDTLEHVEEMREGFVLSQRTSTMTSLSEMRALVSHVLLKQNWWEQFDLIFIPDEQVELLDTQLVVYNHALIALSILPTLPPQAITFPQPHASYADVNVPAEPGQILERIEEIEGIIYKASFASPKDLSYPAFRRTYAFFEASDWLVNNHLKPLLNQ